MNKINIPNSLDLAKPKSFNEKDKYKLIGTQWEHKSGRVYTIIMFTNLPDDERYPLTVVYQDKKRNLWSRKWSDWHRSMKQIEGLKL